MGKGEEGGVPQRRTRLFWGDLGWRLFGGMRHVDDEEGGREEWWCALCCCPGRGRTERRPVRAPGRDRRHVLARRGNTKTGGLRLRLRLPGPALRVLILIAAAVRWRRRKRSSKMSNRGVERDNEKSGRKRVPL